MKGARTDPSPEGLWARLRRRKVVQWGLAYAAGAWGLLQGVDFLVDAFHWPDAIKQYATLATVVGLAIALVLAWFHGERGQQRPTAIEIATLATLLAAGGGLLWLYERPIEPVLAEPQQEVSTDPAANP